MPIIDVLGAQTPHGIEPLSRLPRHQDDAEVRLKAGFRPTFDISNHRLSRFKNRCTGLV